MIGRGVFGNPWIFDEAKTKVSVRERLEAMLVLTELFVDVWEGAKSFELLKKHFQAYIAGFPGARELRAELMLVYDGQAVKDRVRSFLSAHAALAEQEILLK